MPVLTDLSVAPAKIDSPLDTIGKIAALKGSQAETALRQAQTAQAGLETQNIAAQAEQRNRDLADQNLLQKSMEDPAIAKQVGAGNFTALEGKAQPKSLMAWRAANDAHVKDVNTNDAEALKNALTKHKIVEDAFTGLLADPADPAKEADDATVAKGYPGLISRLIADGTIPPEIAQQLPSTVTSAKQVKDLLAKNNYLAGVSEQLLNRQKTQAENAQKTAQAASEQATADDKRFDLDLKKGTLNGGSDAAIDARFAGHPDAAIAAKAAWKQNLPAGIDKATEAVNTVYANTIGEAQQQASLLPGKLKEQADLLPGDVKKAVQVESATAPIKLSGAVAQAKALRMGDNQAVAGVAPSAIQGVQDHAIKLDQEYAGVKEATDAMDRLIALATGGNKAAGANLPLAGVGAVNAINGIKRINSAEIHQYGTAGSLLDEIKGKLGKWTEGKPIPAGVLADIKTLHDDLGAQAYSKYTGELHSLNERTGAQYKPTYEPPSGNMETKQYNGATYTRRAGSSDPWVKK